MTRRPLYIYHGPGQVASRISGEVMDAGESVKLAKSHLELAFSAPDRDLAECHVRLAGDLVAALRQAQSLERAAA